MTAHAAVPYLSVKDANAALAYYTRVFECEPVPVLKMPDGRIMHAEYRFGDATLFVSESLPEHGGTPSPDDLGATTVAIHLNVDACDAMIERMTDAGAELLMAPADMFWGERFGRVRDPFGHEWGISEKLTEMTPAEIQAAADLVLAEMARAAETEKSAQEDT